MSVDRLDVSALPPVVRRRRGYGHDRAYVKAGQHDLGYRDLTTGAVRCERPADAAVIERATADMFARVNEARQVTEYRPRHSRPESPAESESVDNESPVVVGPTVVSAPTNGAGPEAGSGRPAAEEPAADHELLPALLPDQDLADNRPAQASRERANELHDAAPARAFLARAVRTKSEERAFRIGADGEDDVARQLAQLGDGWRVLHAVPIGDGGVEFDHVAIGPAGVFTITVKNHPDATVRVSGTSVRINGVDEPYVRSGKHEAARAALLLSRATGFEVTARAVVAVVGVKRGFTVDEAPKDVTVLRHKDLTRYLATPSLLDEDTIVRIYDAARHLSTWQPKTVARQEFDPTV